MQSTVASGGVVLDDPDHALALDAPDDPRAVDVAGTAPLSTVEVVKNGAVWNAVDDTDDHDAGVDADTASATWTDENPVTGTTWRDGRGGDADDYYVRVRQADPSGDYRFPGAAWAGPVWVEAP